MTNIATNPSPNAEMDSMQAACVLWSNRRKDEAAAETATQRTHARSFENARARQVVFEALGRNADASQVNTEQPADPEDIPRKDSDIAADVYSEAPIVSGANAGVPDLEEMLIAPPKQMLPEPTPLESGPSNSDLANDPRNPVQLPEPARKFGLLTRADVQAEPSAIPLIHGLISKRQLTMIAGPSGSGKSVFQLHLGAALLNAEQVFGHVIPKRSRFLYVNLEGDLKHRLEAIEQHHPGWSFPAPDAIFLTRPWCLNERDSVKGLAHHVNQAGGVDVIFIDTLNRAIPGSDENLSTDMGMVIAHANLLINLTGAAVVLTHHTGKAKEKGPRGHSSLYAALDTCLMVDQAESGLRTVELVKTRQGAGGNKYYFSIENIDLGEDDYGLPVVGPALTEVDGTPEVEKAATAPALTPQQKEALFALTLHLQNGLNGEPLKDITRDEALEVVKLAFSAVSTKHRSTRAREAIDALIEAGRLRKTDRGMLTSDS